jgi:hypothetical protein
VARHEPGQWVVGVLRGGAQVGVPLCLVDDEVEPEHGNVVAERVLQPHDVEPDPLRLVAVDDAAHQSHRGRREWRWPAAAQVGGCRAHASIPPRVASRRTNRTRGIRTTLSPPTGDGESDGSVTRTASSMVSSMTSSKSSSARPR